MGSCFSKTTTELPPPPVQFDGKPEVQQPHSTNNSQQPFKKEIFVIKHRISHESDRHTDKDERESLNPCATAGDCESRNAGRARSRTSSCSKEEVDAILTQSSKLGRSNSTGAQNPSRKRRYSRSKRSFDFDLNTQLNNGDDSNNNDNGDNDGGLNHRQQEARVLSPARCRREREPPRLHRSNSKERRISISPSRRSESPFRNVNAASVPGGSGSNRPPAKMVYVPATDKSNNNLSLEQEVISSVKRIHVKRNVGAASPRARSPAKPLRIFTDNPSHEGQTHTIEDEDEDGDDRLHHGRKSLVEIDNNAARSSQPSNSRSTVLVPTSVEKLKLRQNITRTRRLSRDLDKNPERILDPRPPSYASLLLEDIHNFHQKNTNSNTAAPPGFSLPACVTKACSIMEAVADLNSDTSSFSEDRWRNSTPISDNGVSGATKEQKSSASNSVTGSVETNSSDPVTRNRELVDCPRNGIGRYGGRSSVALA